MKRKATTIKIEVTTNNEFVGAVTMEFKSQKMLADVFYEVAKQLAREEELSGAELRGVLKLFEDS